jgi:DNA polymerase III epsilon subunit-like protein
MYLFFDTETTGLPPRYDAAITDSASWPRLVQLSWLLCDKGANGIKKTNRIIYPEIPIPEDAAKIHGITTARALEEGADLKTVLGEFLADFAFAKILIGHNIDFDEKIVGAEIFRKYGPKDFLSTREKCFLRKTKICTMKAGTDFCKLPGKFEGKFKWPKLTELHKALFDGVDFAEAHNSAADVQATAKCFFEMKRRGIIKI